MNYGQRTTDSGQRTVDNGQRTKTRGPDFWSVVRCPLSVVRLFLVRCLLSIVLLLLLPACAQEKLQIGREDPSKEIQKCTRLSQKKKYNEAVECLEIFKSRFPDSTEGHEAALRIADTYFVQKQYLLAADAYLSFTDLNPLHPKTEYAYYRAGLSYFHEAPKAIDRDQQYLFKAKETMQLALRAAGGGTYQNLTTTALKEINERLAQRLFYVARFYYRTKEYLAAIPRLEELVERFPESSLVPKGLYYLAQCHLQLDQKHDAGAAVQQLSQHFPNSPWTKRAMSNYIKE